MKRATAEGGGPGESATLAEAAAWFCRLHSEDANVDDLSAFRSWLERDADHAVAYRIVCAVWLDFGRYASTPAIMAARREALSLQPPDEGKAIARGRPVLRWMRRTRSRWMSAAAAALIAAGLAALASSGSSWSTDIYSTGAHERRTLTLADGSAVTLDNSSRVRVRYLKTERLITLEQGQACFDVARDAARPFRVTARGETIIALGTQLNVDMIGRDVTIALLQGHVVVLTGKPRDAASPRVELRTGEALRVRHDGSMALLHINVEHVVAWLSGHLAFDNEPLARAAERVSHYGQQRIQVAPSVARIGISGVFNIGDANAFVEAVTAYFPVKAIWTDSSTVVLVPRNPSDSVGDSNGRPRHRVLVAAETDDTAEADD